jgi:hypothetical protein
MLRNEKRSDLIGAIAGAAFVLLLFLSVASLDLPRGKPDQELQTWWADEGLRRASIVSMYLMLLAAPCFLVFLTRLCARLRKVDVEDSWNALVQGAGIVFVALLSVSAVTRGVIAQAVRFNDEPVPGVDTLRYATEISQAAYAFGAVLFATIVIATASILILRTGALMRWVGWVGVGVSALSLAAIVLQVGGLATPLIHVWVLCISLQLFRTRSAHPASAVSPIDAGQPRPQNVLT